MQFGCFVQLEGLRYALDAVLLLLKAINVSVYDMILNYFFFIFLS